MSELIKQKRVHSQANSFKSFSKADCFSFICDFLCLRSELPDGIWGSFVVDPNAFSSFGFLDHNRQPHLPPSPRTFEAISNVIGYHAKGNADQLRILTPQATGDEN